MKQQGDRKIYTVTEVNRKARMVLEGALGELWIEGELSRVTMHGSGHWYFTLKEATAAVSCAMFARDNLTVTFRPKDGLKVQMLARPSLFEASGRYQLIASKMEETGKGNLQEQFEALKKKLAEEGLFEAEKKKKIPLLPRHIGVVTSPTGAAIQDILNVLTRRFPNIKVVLAPVVVQGPKTSSSVSAAINYFNKQNHSGNMPIDVMIIGRGGGSIEDLWGFNEEVVARAIAASDIPIISAVGHEIDFTISDFVADLRAPTPSAAAELAVPIKTEIEEQIHQLNRRLQQALLSKEQQFRLRLNRAAHSYVFKEPEVLVQRYQTAISNLKVRMVDLLQYNLKEQSNRLERTEIQINYLLQSSIHQTQQRIDELSMQMQHQIVRKKEDTQQRVLRLKSQLRMLNPLAVLGRGYSLTRLADGSVIRTVKEAETGERLITQVADGTIESNILSAKSKTETN